MCYLSILIICPYQFPQYVFFVPPHHMPVSVSSVCVLCPSSSHARISFLSVYSLSLLITCPYQFPQYVFFVPPHHMPVSVSSVCILCPYSSHARMSFQYVFFVPRHHMPVSVSSVCVLCPSSSHARISFLSMCSLSLLIICPYQFNRLSVIV